MKCEVRIIPSRGYTMNRFSSLIMVLLWLLTACADEPMFQPDVDGGPSDTDTDNDTDTDTDTDTDSDSDTDTDTDTDTDSDTDPVFPATCAEYLLENPGASDGEYTIYVDNDEAKPWSAYCHDMAGTPLEYLTLVNTDGSYNYAQYTAGGSSPGTDVRTYYYKLRIDPVILGVVINDLTFSSSTGSLFHSGGSMEVVSICYTVAINCIWPASSSGSANANLLGTPFRMLNDFCGYGNSPYGEAILSSNNQVVDILGGGACGWWAVTGNSSAGGEPVNEDCNGTLELEYVNG